MKKTFLFIAIAIFMCSAAFSQSYNLGFSQAVDLSNGQTYTVPSGKVFKLETVNVNQATATYNFEYCSCSNSYCYYRAYLYSIGSYTDSITASTYIYGTCSCGNCAATYTGPMTSSINLSLPMWLKAGETITIVPGTGVLFTGIEFNLQ